MEVGATTMEEVNKLRQMVGATSSNMKDGRDHPSLEKLLRQRRI